VSSTELDLPFLPNSDKIRRREFVTIRRGYDPEQVRDYLQQVASRVETLEHELREARLHAIPQGQVVPLPEQGPADDPYERLAARVADLLRASDEQAERILQDAREEGERLLSSLAARRETFVEQMQQMQSRLIGFAQKLEATIDELSDDDEPRLDAMSQEPVATQPVETKPAGSASSPASVVGPSTIDSPYVYVRPSREPGSIALEPGDHTLGQEDPSEH
jgi:DivIVA domain-containing protein